MRYDSTSRMLDIVHVQKRFLLAAIMTEYTASVQEPLLNVCDVQKYFIECSSFTCTGSAVSQETYQCIYSLQPSDVAH